MGRCKFLLHRRCDAPGYGTVEARARSLKFEPAGANLTQLNKVRGTPQLKIGAQAIFSSSIIYILIFKLLYKQYNTIHITEQYKTILLGKL